MKRLFGVLLLLVAVSFSVHGNVRLPSAVGNNMVLQQQTHANLWGWADPNVRVVVTTSWNNKSYTTRSNADGDWIVSVATEQGSYTPHKITIDDGTPLTVSNVLIGEVWICSGQSNMSMALCGYTGQPIDNSLATILASGSYKDKIRFVTLPQRGSDAPVDDFDGRWEVSSPESAYQFSAAAYFFARTLTEALGVPVGIVSTSWGGSSIEAWIDVKTAKSINGFETDHSAKLGVPQRLASLYNGLIYPVKNYTARGFLWYQGESNIRNYKQYTALMTAMVNLWREQWSNASMPFYYVQLAPYSYEDRNDISASLLIESQIAALKTIPNSGMVSLTDVGDEWCIHPPQKEAVGFRLANLALVDCYKVQRNLPSTGPMMREVKFNGANAVVSYNNVPTGLTSRNQPIVGFEMAGNDRKFHPATASIDHNRAQVTVVCDKVAVPVAVRYAFRNYMVANLQNTFGLPAFPFRTDAWDNSK